MNDACDLIVIGGGAAGLTAAGLGASFGAKTVLVEQDRLGGDCTWTGCVPSKALLRSAETAHEGEAPAGEEGQGERRFLEAMRRARHIRQEIYEDADAPENMEELGVDVRSGHARLMGPHTAEIDEGVSTRRLEADYVILATGGRPAAPPIDGLKDVSYLTNETLFELEEQPAHLAVLGAGPIGTEMAQAFRRLGSEVTVLERAGRILQHDHPRLAGMLREALEAEGVTYRLGAGIERVEPAPGDRNEGRGAVIQYEQSGQTHTLSVDALLVAAGRRPNVEGLGLEAAGVDFDENGITVSERCRTSRRHIYAAGDVTGRYQFTHMSEHMAKVAVTNALLKAPQKIDAGRVPWVTYTDPELAHVGKTEEELREEGTRYEVYRFPLDRLDRAFCEGRTRGEIRVYATKWTGKIRGASVLAPRAGELIGTVAVAMKAGASLAKISDTIFPYPTYGQGVRRAADQWYAQKQKPWLVRGLQRVFGYDGPVIEPDPDRIV